VRFLSYANGSLKELETEIIAANRLKFIEQEVMETTMVMTSDVGRMLTGLSRSLRARRST
jgi:four helix bundle protein